MAFQLSPGINVSEIDLSTIVPAVGTTVGAIAGPFRWGPCNQMLLVDSELTLSNTFGTPDNNTAVNWFTAANFLSYASALQTVRVIKTGVNGHKNATSDGTGLLIQNQNAYLHQYADGSGGVGMWAAKYPGDLGNTIAVSIADANSFATWKFREQFDRAPSTSPFVENAGGANDEIHAVVYDQAGRFSGTPGAILEIFPYLSKCATAKSENGATIYYAEVLNRQSKYIYWMDHPSEADLGISVSVNWGGIETTNFQLLNTKLTFGSPSGSFQVGETITSSTKATITPAGSGAAATASVSGGGIGTVSVTVGGSGYAGAPNVVITGDGTGATATATVSNGVVTGVTVTAPGTGYTNATVSFVVPGSGATASVTVSSTGVITAVTASTPGSGYTSVPNVSIVGPGVNANVVAVLGTGGTAGQVVSYTVVSGGTGYSPITATVLSWNTPNLVVAPTSGVIVNGLHFVGATSAASGTVSAVAGGSIANILAGGVDANASLSDGDYMIGYDLFSDAGNVDVSLILGGAASAGLATYLITNVAEVRRDCVVFISPPYSAVVDNAGLESNDIITFRDLLPSSSYAVMDSGWKYQYDKYADLYRWTPLNGDIAGLCVNTDNVRDPWWSPAGYNRGMIKNLVKLAWNPRKAYRDALYKMGINPVISEPGQGTLLYGDKTLLARPSAFDRINVRRLFIVLEKAIATAAKFTLFEFNDQFTQAMFLNMVEPYLRDVKGRRGITDFKVVCDSTNNTADVVDGNMFVGDIYVKPTRSINFIQLNFVAVRTGVSFQEIVGSF